MAIVTSSAPQIPRYLACVFPVHGPLLSLCIISTGTRTRLTFALADVELSHCLCYAPSGHSYTRICLRSFSATICRHASYPQLTIRHYLVLYSMPEHRQLESIAHTQHDTFEKSALCAAAGPVTQPASGHTTEFSLAAALPTSVRMYVPPLISVRRRLTCMSCGQTTSSDILSGYCSRSETCTSEYFHSVCAGCIMPAHALPDTENNRPMRCISAIVIINHSDGRDIIGPLLVCLYASTAHALRGDLSAHSLRHHVTFVTFAEQ